MKERVLTAIVLLAVVVGALFFDPTGWVVKILLCTLALLSAVELKAIVKGHWVGVIFSAAVGVPILFGRILPTPLCIGMAVFGVLGLFWGVKHERLTPKLLGSTGWIWGTILPLYTLAATKAPTTWPLVMTAAIPIWCGDTVAIFAGRAFGKHKLAPEISPKKTWEGAIGNFLACILTAFTLGAIFHYPALAMLLLGLNCGILGQAGDLFESWLKRKADMKDSGKILPGHGGILDRIDSLMATAPLSLLIVQMIIPVVAK